MAWQLFFSPHFERAFRKLDRQTARRIRVKILEYVEQENPGQFLIGSDLRKWRIGEYRVIFQIATSEKEVELVAIGKRDSIYKKFL